LTLRRIFVLLTLRRIEGSLASNIGLSEQLEHATALGTG
jgi:hypothetical protein